MLARTFSTLALSLAMLAGCGSGEVDSDGDGKITVAEAAAKSDEFVKPEPGQYKVTAEIVDVKIPGAPPELEAMMKKMMAGGSQAHEYCLTAEDAAKGFEEMAKQSQDAKDCTYERFTVTDGDLDAKMICKDKERGTVTMTMQGKATPTSSDMTMNMDAKGPDGKAIQMTMKSSQQRIGACKT